MPTCTTANLPQHNHRKLDENVGLFLCEKSKISSRESHQNERIQLNLRKYKKYSENSLTFNFVRVIVNEINERTIRLE